MIGRFIIVERDPMLRDCGVFTGQIQIVDTRLRYWDQERQLPMQAMDGVSSTHIEHAFLFNAAWAAWRFAMQFEPHWDDSRHRYFAARRWVARKDGDYFPGECRTGTDAPNPLENAKAWIPQEALVAASMEGFEQGCASVRREMEPS